MGETLLGGGTSTNYPEAFLTVNTLAHHSHSDPPMADHKADAFASALPTTAVLNHKPWAPVPPPPPIESPALGRHVGEVGLPAVYILAARL